MHLSAFLTTCHLLQMALTLLTEVPATIPTAPRSPANPSHGAGDPSSEVMIGEYRRAQHRTSPGNSEDLDDASIAAVLKIAFQKEAHAFPQAAARSRNA